MAGNVKVINIFPLDEVDQHEKHEDCKCVPTVEPVGGVGRVIIHNLIDGGKCFHVEITQGWS